MVQMWHQMLNLQNVSDSVSDFGLVDRAYLLRLREIIDSYHMGVDIR